MIAIIIIIIYSVLMFISINVNNFMYMYPCYFHILMHMFHESALLIMFTAFHAVQKHYHFTCAASGFH